MSKTATASGTIPPAASGAYFLLPCQPTATLCRNKIPTPRSTRTSSKLLMLSVRLKRLARLLATTSR
jgi:hypothetical protein